MRIKSVTITDQDKKEYGLSPCKLERLGEVLVIAGKNGSGKSRFLRLLKTKIQNGSYDIAYHSDETAVTSVVYFDQEALASTIMDQQIQNFIAEIRRLDKIADYPERTKAKDTAVLQLKSIVDIVELMTGKGWRFRVDKEIGGKSTEVCFFDNQSYSFSKLSEGEKVALYYCALFYFQTSGGIGNVDSLEKEERSLGNSIVIIDEPETHLHPIVQIELMQTLSRMLKKNGQLIIATHSLSILSCVTSEQIYCAEKGSVYPPSREITAQVLESLLGHEDSVRQHIYLLNNQYNWTTNSFAAQCLLSPTTASYKKDDPQIALVNELLTKPSVKVLDFGCGQARLFEAIRDNPNINYSGYDPSPSEILKDTKDFSLYNSIPQLKRAGKFNFVVMCNVLHEIPIDEWLVTIKTIADILDRRGYLLLLEDKQLPVGEKPTDNGFLVLTEAQVNLLFGSEVSHLRSRDTRYKNRLYCSVVPQSAVEQVTIEGIKSALLSLKDLCISESQSIYSTSNGSDRSSSKRLAFLALQALNCQIAERKLISVIKASEKEDKNDPFVDYFRNSSPNVANPF